MYDFISSVDWAGLSRDGFLFLTSTAWHQKEGRKTLACTIPRVFFVEDYSYFIMRSFQPPCCRGSGSGMHLMSCTIKLTVYSFN